MGMRVFIWDMCMILTKTILILGYFAPVLLPLLYTMIFNPEGYVLSYHTVGVFVSVFIGFVIRARVMESIKPVYLKYRGKKIK